MRTFFVVCLCAFVSPSNADIIFVDFGVADGEKLSVSPNEVQSGFEDFSFTQTGDGAPGFYDFVNVGIGTHSRTFGDITARVRGTANGISAYDFATDVTHTYGDLAEDVIRVIQGDIYLTIDGLDAGIYELTTYHHFAFDTSAPLEFDIYLDNGSGEELVASDVETSFGYTPTTISTETFTFSADGTNDVILRLDGGGSGSNLINPVLNGFKVETIPEPAAFGSLIMAGVFFLLTFCLYRKKMIAILV